MSDLHDKKGHFKKGNKGYWLGKKRSNMTGVNHPMYGKTFTVEHRSKISESLKGNNFKNSGQFKKGNVPWMKGRKQTEEVRKKNSESHKGIHFSIF